MNEVHTTLTGLQRTRSKADGAVACGPKELVVGDVAEVKKSFKAALRRAGLPESVRWHDMRHTFGSWLAATVSHAVLKELMGHGFGGDITMHYVHITEAQLRKGVAKLPALLGLRAAPEAQAAAPE